MTAEEYFYNYWQKANRSRFGDYGDYDSDEYAIAFANDYAALRIHDVSGSLPLADLEKRLDEALDKETPETLNKWLEEKRK